MYGLLAVIRGAFLAHQDVAGYRSLPGAGAEIVSVPPDQNDVGNAGKFLVISSFH